MPAEDPVTGFVEAAGGLVIDAAGRVAVVHRPHRSDWSLPKGHLHRGESPEAGALREVVEETGLRCEIVSPAGESRYADARGRRKRVRYYEMRVVDGRFEANDEVDELAWVDPDDVSILTYPGDRDLVRRWRADRESQRGG